MIKMSVLCLLGLGLSGLPAAGQGGEVGQIRVNSDPPGALVSLDECIQDVTPLTMTNVIPGVHLVAARKEGYREGRLTIKLGPGQKTVADFKLEPIKGLILIHSTPKNAEVQVDGGYRGRTPLLLTDLPVGKYRLKVGTPGFSPQEVDLTIENRIPKKIDLTLTSSSAQLRIVSQPPGATVTINGTSVGATPCVLDRIPAGNKQIVISQKGYYDSRHEIVLELGSSNLVNAVLTPIPGSLQVVSTPPKARIYLDDQFRGETPLALTNLAPGSYTVKVESKGYEVLTKTAEIQQGGAVTLEFPLVRNSGILELITEPAGVRVYVDGEDRGVTRAGETDLISNPFRVEFLSQGLHRLQLTRKGYYSLEKNFDIEIDKTGSLHESLKKRFLADTEIRMSTEGGKEEIVRGAVNRRSANGDIELETSPGIFVTVAKGQIIAVKPVVINPKE